MLIQLVFNRTEGHLLIKTGKDEDGFRTCDFKVTDGKSSPSLQHAIPREENT